MYKEIFADLHNHTTASDGDFSPEALIKTAKSLKIKAVGVTDHDTVSGVESAIAAGKKYDVEVVPGVEISIRFKENFFTGTLHLLCYFTEQKLFQKGFVEKLGAVLSRGRGKGLVAARVEQINRCFGPVGDEPLLQRELKVADIDKYSENASRRHFALTLENDFNITDKQQINHIIGNDSPAYLPSGIDFGDAMAFAKSFELTSVLAHPAAGSYTGKGHYKEVLPPLKTVERLLPRFLDQDLRGVEVYYPGHMNEHQQIVMSWAETHGLIVTGGSDCHDGVNRPMGICGLDEKQFLQFKAVLK